MGLGLRLSQRRDQRVAALIAWFSLAGSLSACDFQIFVSFDEEQPLFIIPVEKRSSCQPGQTLRTNNDCEESRPGPTALLPPPACGLRGPTEEGLEASHTSSRGLARFRVAQVSRDQLITHSVVSVNHWLKAAISRVLGQLGQRIRVDELHS